MIKNFKILARFIRWLKELNDLSKMKEYFFADLLREFAKINEKYQKKKKSKPPTEKGSNSKVISFFIIVLSISFLEESKDLLRYRNGRKLMQCKCYISLYFFFIFHLNLIRM